MHALTLGPSGISEALGIAGSFQLLTVRDFLLPTEPRRDERTSRQTEPSRKCGSVSASRRFKVHEGAEGSLWL